MKAIFNGKIIMEDAVVKNKAILYDKKILAIIDEKEIESYEVSSKLNAGGNYISPGFIDIHIHGSGGCDTMDGTIESLQTISKTIATRGVTSFLPTTMTMDKEYIYRALNAIRVAMSMEMEGAKILGCHMEGPFINERYKGAQDFKHILEPSFEFIKDFLDLIRIITLAPEKDRNYNFIRKMREYKNIVISMGHTNATYRQCLEAIDVGVSHATHLFNAMTPLNHREPGAVGAILQSDITCELISDKIHIHPGLFGLVTNIKGKHKVVLITDSMRAGCMKEGEYDLGGQRVVVKDNSARLYDGTLAGSVVSLNIAVKNMKENTNLEIYEAVAMASLNPAKVISVDNYKGSIAIGKDADITIFDEEFHVLNTIVEGKEKYCNNSRW